MAEPARAVFERIANRTRTRHTRVKTDAFIIIVSIYNAEIISSRHADFRTIDNSCVHRFLLNYNNLRIMTFTVSMRNTQKTLLLLCRHRKLPKKESLQTLFGLQKPRIAPSLVNHICTLRFTPPNRRQQLREMTLRSASSLKISQGFPVRLRGLASGTNLRAQNTG